MQIDNDEFSPREREVIQRLLEGKSNKEIALVLGISARTVEFHLKNVYRKLKVGSRTEAVLELGKLRGGTRPDKLVDSTVAGSREEAENSDTSGLMRRLLMKSFPYIPIIVLSATVIVLILVFSRLPSRGVHPEDTVTSIATAMVVLSQTTQAPAPNAVPAPATSAQSEGAMSISIEDEAHFVSENYPDGSSVTPGARFTKKWTLQNWGKTTWATSYSLVITGGSYPLEGSQVYPIAIKLPHEVKPGEYVEVSAEFSAPNSDSIYEVHYRFVNKNGQTVSGDGSEIWLKVAVGNAKLPVRSTGTSNVTMQLDRIEKTDSATNVEVCAQLPSTLDWNFNDVLLSAGSVRNYLSGIILQNAKDPATYSSSHRCYVIDFPVGTGNYGTAPISISIGNIRVPSESKLEENCARAKTQLTPLYPGLDFTCGPAGFFYTNLQLGSGMDSEMADRIIMDVMEQVIYGPWVLSE